MNHWINSRKVAASQGEAHWAEIACGRATTTKGRSCQLPDHHSWSGPPFSAATGASTAGAVSSTPRAESGCPTCSGTQCGAKKESISPLGEHEGAPLPKESPSRL